MSQNSGPEVLVSVAKVAELMKVSEWAVRQAIKRNRLGTATLMIDNKLRVAIPLSAMAEYWDLPVATVNRIESDARQECLEAPYSVVKRLSLPATAGADDKRAERNQDRGRQTTS